MSSMAVMMGLCLWFAVHESKKKPASSMTNHGSALPIQAKSSPTPPVASSMSGAASSPTDHTGNPTDSAKGDAPGLPLLMDSFNNSGSLLDSAPQVDIHGGGWTSAHPALQPRRDNGLLVSGGESSTASLQLPPISPHGEVSISMQVLLRGSSSFSLGLTTGASSDLARGDGPFVQVMGDGRIALCANAGSRIQTTLSKPDATAEHSVALVMLHRLWNHSLSVYANGSELATMTMPKSVGEAGRWLTISFASADAKGAPGLNDLRVDYTPVPRPTVLVPHRTVTVTDTTREGILKAIGTANATTGPDNIVEISIPKGDYIFSVPKGTDRNHIFSTYGLKYMIIDWNGSSITITDPDLGFQCLSDGNNVTVRNIASIDYPQDNLPFTQGTVRAIDTAALTFDLEIDAGYPKPDNAYFSSRTPMNSEHWGQLIDEDHPGRQPAGVKREYWIKAVRRLENGMFRYTLKEPHMNGFRIGVRFADCPRSGNEIFRVFSAKKVRLENITGHSCPNFWSMIYFTSISYHNVQVRLKPGRLMTANGDLVSGVDNLLWMERCRFEGNADDICHQFRGRATFITDTEFRDNRRFGVWFNTSAFGVVKNCLFDGVGFHAIAGMKEPGMDEGGQFGSRNVLCVDNRILNVRDSGIFLNSCHTKSDSSPHWNVYWRLVRNQSSTPIRIHNATDVRLVDNRGDSNGPAAVDHNPGNTKNIEIISSSQ